MPRHSREKCASGIYHIMVRGINRQNIFNDEDDYIRYLDTIRRMKIDNRFELYCYCLMTNHVHLLIKEKGEDTSRVMKRIGTSYAFWYNSKYARVGHLFQDRYKSEGIDNDAYLLSVIRYIHKNPVKAKMVQEPQEYKWSSCQQYYGYKEIPVELTDTDFILGIFAENKDMATKRLVEHTKEASQEVYLDDETKVKKKDAILFSEIEAILNGHPISILKSMKKQERDQILQRIKAIEGSNQRQIARVTGLNPNIIFKA